MYEGQGLKSVVGCMRDPQLQVCMFFRPTQKPFFVLTFDLIKIVSWRAVAKLFNLIIKFIFIHFQFVQNAKALNITIHAKQFVRLQRAVCKFTQTTNG